MQSVFGQAFYSKTVLVTVKQSVSQGVIVAMALAMSTSSFHDEYFLHRHRTVVTLNNCLR